jgi:hypothetical protein
MDEGDIEQGGTSFTEITNQGWGSRMKNSFGGVCIGLIFFFGSFALLFWNEGRAVNRAKDLEEGIQAVVPLTTLQTTVGDASNNGKLVHLTGDIHTNEKLVDPLLNVSTTAIKFRRYVEMYQWKEIAKTTSSKTSSGGTQKETTYSYSKTWSSSLIRSTNFREKYGHVNPTQFLLDPLYLEANDVMIGAFAVSDSIVDKMNWFTDWTESVSVSNIADASLKSKAKPNKGNGFYFGNNSASPFVGDSRVTFDVVLPDTISIVAMLTSTGRLATFITSRGGKLLLFRRGSYSSAELFSEAQSDNKAVTWGVRIGGFLLMFFGVLLVLQPIATLVDIIPCVGDFMEGALQTCVFPLVALVITVPLSLFTIALAWIVYRPIFAGVLIIVVALITIIICVIVKKKNSSDMQQDDDEAVVEEGEVELYEQPHKPEEPDIQLEEEPAIAIAPVVYTPVGFTPVVYKP